MKYEYKDVNKKIVEKKNPNLWFDGSLILGDFIYLLVSKINKFNR